MDIKATLIGGRQAMNKQRQSNNTNESSISNNGGNDEVMTLMHNCYRAYYSEAISAHSVATIITNKIRSIYYTTCSKNGDRFDVETFIYMDKIVFDQLSALIESVVKNGRCASLGAPSAVNKSLIKEFIRNGFAIVEYETDIKSIEYVIDALYDVYD